MEEDALDEIIRREWHDAAHELADWTFHHLVNRRDVWGQYTKLSFHDAQNRKRGYKALTLPQKAMRGKDMVTLDKLMRHFRSTSTHHLIGLHATSAEGTCRWLALDIDLHDPSAIDVEDIARRNFSAALAWWDEMQGLGYDPLLLDSNGVGGYHLMVVFEQPAPSGDVFAMGQNLVATWKKKNVDGPPEQFPKNAQLSEGKLGAWLRLFGRHHTFPHFTRVWSGDSWLDEPWLEGSAAIDAILKVRLGPAPPSIRLDDEPVIIEKGKSPKRTFIPSVKNRPSVCIDLDGVLARFDGWRGYEHFGDPLPGAVEFTRSIHTFADIVILTSRCSGENGGTRESLVRDWLDTHRFVYDTIYTGCGKPFAHAYVDDRSVPCLPQQHGPTVFLAAESEVRRLCEQTYPEQEATPDADLARIIAAWPHLSVKERQKLLTHLGEQR